MLATQYDATGAAMFDHAATATIATIAAGSTLLAGAALLALGARIGRGVFVAGTIGGTVTATWASLPFESVGDLQPTLFAVAATALAAWYFYRRHNVVTYYRALRDRDRDRKQPPAAAH
jgi:hypothetical protein